ncbi:pyridoxal phosphate-dependent aminotransferase [Paludibaculum fermentans]|uniref:pyridoxal phosphate-dependent aminotransferase n=1 Tax=Paludibaculum fermentans TaxID=1473598 RepID=UPI003EBB6B4E
MNISQAITTQLANSSWIRRMFEEGARMKQERGAENVYDFTLGNPDVEPPAQVLQALQRVVAAGLPNAHGYMPNPGFPLVRQAVARQLRRETGLPFDAEDIFMTVGSAGACNVILKSILDPGDEVIVLMPCFSEYRFYISNHAGRMVPVETGADFLPDIDRIAAAITPRTRAIILNTPNNPTGRVYPASVLRDLNSLLAGCDHEILVISDEPYKHLVFDGKSQPEVASLIANTAICNSWSKSQALPGERIGYLALSPLVRDRTALRAACAFTNRILGFINAPALWQLVELQAMESTVDVSGYERKRDLLCDSLTAAGYDVRKPEGTFYVFMKTPIADDIAFVRLLAKEGVLGVPGAGFGRAGYLRLSLTVPEEMIRKSIPGFAAALQAVAAASV